MLQKKDSVNGGMMVKQRENYKVVVAPMAQERIRHHRCPWCGKPKEEWIRRKDWTCCSIECTKQNRNNYLIYGWQELRLKALIRDNYTCKHCRNKFDDNKLVGDHIMPIALGGEEWSLSNIQTLCKSCNKLKTKEDITKIAILRKKEKNEQKGQTILG